MLQFRVGADAADGGRDAGWSKTSFGWPGSAKIESSQALMLHGREYVPEKPERLYASIMAAHYNEGL